MFGVCVVYNIAARYEFILQVNYSRINKLIQTILQDFRSAISYFIAEFMNRIYVFRLFL